MAEKDTSDAGEGSPSRSEAQNFAVMFKSVMNDMKELKQTVASLLEPVDDGGYEDNTAESNDLEGAATPVSGKEPNPDETSKTPAATASGSKLLAEIVQDLDIEEKTGNDVDEGLVKLLNGLLNCRHDKSDHFSTRKRRCRCHRAEQSDYVNFDRCHNFSYAMFSRYEFVEAPSDE